MSNSTKPCERFEIPAFTLFGRQPKVPWRIGTIAQANIPNEHGTMIHYRVEHTSRVGGKDHWYISASHGDTRASATLHTSSEKVAAKWIAAVEGGCIGISDKPPARRGQKNFRW